VTDTPRNRTPAESSHPEPAPNAACEPAPSRAIIEGFARTPKLWKYRPFTRVVRGYKAYKIVRDYIQLNEKEATGEVRYSKQRLRGLLADELSRLWQ
jgi:hypothetical protein